MSGHLRWPVRTLLDSNIRLQSLSSSISPARHHAIDPLSFQSTTGIRSLSLGSWSVPHHHAIHPLSFQSPTGIRSLSLGLWPVWHHHAIDLVLPVTYEGPIASTGV